MDFALLPQVSLNDIRIAMAERVKYLGVWLDDKLSLGVQIQYTKARAVKRIALLKCNPLGRAMVQIRAGRVRELN